jgi:hypothetical protein
MIFKFYDKMFLIILRQIEPKTTEINKHQTKVKEAIITQEKLIFIYNTSKF